MRFTVTDWCFDNCIFNGIHGFINWGNTLLVNDRKEISVCRSIQCEVVRETEKAIQISFPYSVTDNRCNVVRTFDSWKVWIPKKCILWESDSDNKSDSTTVRNGYRFLCYTDFGFGYRGITCEEMLKQYVLDGYTVKKKW